MKLALLFLFSLPAFLSWGNGCLPMQDTVAADSGILVSASRTDRYVVSMDMPKASLTGIMVVCVDDGHIKGSVVNEFGVSAMDFVYDRARDKMKLRHVVSFLDKWYIRMTLRRDMRFCLYTLYGIKPGQRSYVVERTGDEVRITNFRRGITYTFALMEHREEEKEI